MNIVLFLYAMTFVCSPSKPVWSKIVNTNDKKPCSPLNEFISCYERTDLRILRYEATPSGGWTTERELPGDIIEVRFFAFKKDFHLIVKRRSANDRVLKTDIRINVVADGTNTTTIRLSTDAILEVHGRLVSEPAEAQGILLDGQTFTGSIQTVNETYYVEPASTYDRTEMGSVVYRASDVGRWSAKVRIDNSRNEWIPDKAHLVVANVMSWNDRHLLDDIAVDKLTLAGTQKVCHLHVVVDHTFFHGRASGSLSDALFLVVTFVSFASHVFQRTDFNSDGFGDNIVFDVDNLTIYKTAGHGADRLADVGFDIDTLLDRFSTFDFDGSCLAVLLTHRHFAGGTVGLAWMASSSRYTVFDGGLCQRRVIYNQPPTYPKGYYSFNTLVVSTLGRTNSALPTVISSLTLTHELGHSFGAPHDSDDCRPAGHHGNFIMNPYSSWANKPNNFRFSACSRRYMNPVIANKGHCLQTRPVGVRVCGDGVIDPGEQCDCTDVVHCMLTDPCCRPPGPEGCTYVSGECSPTASACCSFRCDVLPNATVCSMPTECRQVSLCDGLSPECPVPEHRPDRTPCNGNSGVCHEGKCTTDLCVVRGLRRCQCTGNPAYYCVLCCRNGTTCVPSHLLGIVAPSGDRVYLTNGHLCADGRGFCDEHHRCLQYEGDADFKKMNMFLLKNAALTFFVWFQDYWYLLVVGLAGVILGTAMCQAYYKSRWQQTDEPAAYVIRSQRVEAILRRAAEEKRRIQQDRQTLLDTDLTRLLEQDTDNGRFGRN